MVDVRAMGRVCRRARPRLMIGLQRPLAGIPRGRGAIHGRAAAGWGAVGGSWALEALVPAWHRGRALLGEAQLGEGCLGSARPRFQATGVRRRGIRAVHPK